MKNKNYSGTKSAFIFWFLVVVAIYLFNSIFESESRTTTAQVSMPFSYSDTSSSDEISEDLENYLEVQEYKRTKYEDQPYNYGFNW